MKGYNDASNFKAAAQVLQDVRQSGVPMDDNLLNEYIRLSFSANDPVAVLQSFSDLRGQPSAQAFTCVLKVLIRQGETSRANFLLRKRTQRALPVEEAARQSLRTAGGQNAPSNREYSAAKSP